MCVLFQNNVCASMCVLGCSSWCNCRSLLVFMRVCKCVCLCVCVCARASVKAQRQPAAVMNPGWGWV